MTTWAKMKQEVRWKKQSTDPNFVVGNIDLVVVAVVVGHVVVDDENDREDVILVLSLQSYFYFHREMLLDFVFEIVRYY